ncbi:hypothetical protein QG37_03638 [Candidozyma auris]|nr:hypothetical protein QG37_03638 [[Candida] auris]
MTQNQCQLSSLGKRSWVPASFGFSEDPNSVRSDSWEKVHCRSQMQGTKHDLIFGTVEVVSRRVLIYFFFFW